jgi:murein L,D-transpeptidase YcbB/YkuD
MELPYLASPISFKIILPAGRYTIVSLGLVLLSTACNSISAGKKNDPPTVRDTSVNPQNAFINTFLDSNTVTLFLSKASLSNEDSLDMVDFYKGRNYEFAWFDSAGLTGHAASFISLYRNYRNLNNDKDLFNKGLDEVLDRFMEDSARVSLRDDLVTTTELGLTRQFFIYSHKAYSSDINPEDLGWFIPKKKVSITSFLDSVVTNKDAKISDFEPVHPMFSPLHDYLEKYTAIEKNNEWPVINFTRKDYKVGDSASEIGLVKKRLQLVEDLPASDSGNVFTEATKKGVTSFQHRYGLKEDGIITQKVMKEMNRPVTDRIKQIMVNIERLRWLPRPGKGRYILVNIPAFRLNAFDSGKLQFHMKVVVGSQANNTVVFSDVVEIVAFSPYWNVPYSIVKNEMSGKSASYFSRNNYEIIGHYSDGRPMVRQKPGPRNALGRVKFLFPNSYSIYMHDTPSKSLFNQDYRAASHGCIRLADPEKMAVWLFDYDPKWTLDSIRKSMQLTSEKQVKLARTVPVYIVYFTSWVDLEGKLNFRDDIYGHDKKMVDQLFAAN